MHIATTEPVTGDTTAVLIDAERGAVPAGEVLGGEYRDALQVIRDHPAEDLASRLRRMPDSAFRPAGELTLTAPYRKPRLIWGIGLNYREHAADLSETAPAEEPASFI